MTGKVVLCGLVLALVAGTALAAIPDAGVPGAKATKYAAVVLDSDSGIVLYERNAEFSRYPASLTKVMTLYLAFDALKTGRIKLTSSLPVSEHAASRDPSRLGLSPGSSITLENAIKAMTTKSANDAASVVAEALGKGSESRFAEMMTAKARQLGMKRTTFRNASGLPDSGHVSSALDLAILARAVVRDFPEHYHFFAVSHFEFHGKRYASQNRFLRSYVGADGIKTGFVNSSGHNLAASAVRGGKRLITVVLGGDTARWTREYASQLLDIAYADIDPKLVVIARPAGGQAGASVTGNASAAAAPTTAATVSGSARTTPPSLPATGANAAAAAATLPSASRSTATETLLAVARPAKTSGDVAGSPRNAATAPTAAAKTPGNAAGTAGDAAKASSDNAKNARRPAVTSREAAVTSRETAVTSRETVVTSRETAVTSDEAAVTSREAAATSNEAAVTSREITVTADEAAVASREATRSASAPTPDPAKSTAALRARAWSVQVGLYRDRALAEKRGREARERVPGQLGKAPLMMAGHGSDVSPRFGGLSESDARQACTQLQRASLPCVVVPPGRSLIVATN